MDTQSLQAFVAVAQSESFSVAAQQLHLTQPAVSKRIAALEQRLNQRLFDRIGRRVSLTEAGTALLPGARRILRDVADTMRDMQELGGRIGGNLRLGISHHIGLHRVPPALQRFSRRYPGVRLDIHFLDSEQAREQVLHGQLELGVITLGTPTDSALHSASIWRDELLFCCAPDHPLTAASSQPLTLETLSRYPAIMPDLRSHTGRIVGELFSRADLPLDVAISTHNLETIRMMVSIGLGWSVLPSTLLDNGLQRLDVPGLSLHRNLGCVWHPRRSLSNAARAFAYMLGIPGEHLQRRDT